MSRRTGKLYTLTQCSMGRNAIHMQQLEGSQPQSRLNRLRQRQFGPLQQRLDAGIKRDLPAQRTQHQRRGQILIGLRKQRQSGTVQKIIAMSTTGRYAFENLKRCQARRSDAGKRLLG
jgi:hypothetical protein